MNILWLICMVASYFRGGSAGPCPSDNIIDASRLSRDLYNMRKLLGGHTDVDLWFPIYKHSSPFGQVVITCPCDLECYDFDSLLTRSCRWYNEQDSCNGKGDEMDFIRMRGRWGDDAGGLLFAKKDKADGFFLIVGTEQKKAPSASAMLVSDPIQCQEADGIVRFRHWTSPGVKVRVCIRPPSRGKRYDWCSEPVKRNGTEHAEIVIPGSVLYMFEIVIEAYNFVLDAFGKQGGAAILDDISYNASAIYNCKMIPHFEPLAPLDVKTCTALQCNFDFGTCISKLKGTGWQTTEEAVGPRSSGIRGNLEGTYAYARGPGTYSIQLGPFTLSRAFAIEFCYYAASFKSKFAVYLVQEDQEKEQIYKSEPVHGQSHHWVCEKIIMTNGTYEYIEFSAEKLRNDYSYVGLDQIGLVDPMRGVGACDAEPRQSLLVL